MDKVNKAAGIVRGVRAVIVSLLHTITSRSRRYGRGTALTARQRRSETDQQEVTWRTNTIALSVKMVADRF